MLGKFLLKVNYDIKDTQIYFPISSYYIHVEHTAYQLKSMAISIKAGF